MRGTKFGKIRRTLAAGAYGARAMIKRVSLASEYFRLAELARSQGGVVTRSQAHILGYSWRRLDTLAKREMIAPLLGQWVVRCTVTEWHLAVAHALTLRLGPVAIVTGAAAAQCLGATGEWPDRFGVAKPMAYIPVESHRMVKDVHLLRSEMDSEVITCGKLRLADRTIALLDCIDLADDVQREPLADHLLQRRWLERTQIDERIAARRSGRKGRRSTPAQRTAQLQAADGTQSVAERLLKRLLVAARLRPGGKLGWIANHLVQVRDGRCAAGGHGSRSDHGGNPPRRARHRVDADSPRDVRLRSARIDFAWPDCRLAVEVDGRAYHSDDNAFEHDRDRRNDLEGAGWMVLNVTWKTLTHAPESVVHRISRALASRRGVSP